MNAINMHNLESQTFWIYKCSLIRERILVCWMELHQMQMSVLAVWNFDSKKATRETFCEYQNKNYIGMTIFMKSRRRMLKNNLIRIIKLFLIFTTTLETDKTPHEVAFGVFFNLLKTPLLTDLHYLRLLSRLSTNRLNYKLFVFLILSFVFYSCVANIYVHIIKQHFIDFLFRRVDNVIYSVLYLLSY